MERHLWFIEKLDPQVDSISPKIQRHFYGGSSKHILWWVLTHFKLPPKGLLIVRDMGDRRGEGNTYRFLPDDRSPLIDSYVLHERLSRHVVSVANYERDQANSSTADENKSTHLLVRFHM